MSAKSPELPRTSRKGLSGEVAGTSPAGLEGKQRVTQCAQKVGEVREVIRRCDPPNPSNFESGCIAYNRPKFMGGRARVGLYNFPNFPGTDWLRNEISG